MFINANADTCGEALYSEGACSFTTVLYTAAFHQLALNSDNSKLSIVALSFCIERACTPVFEFSLALFAHETSYFLAYHHEPIWRLSQVYIIVKESEHGVAKPIF